MSILPNKKTTIIRQLILDGEDTDPQRRGEKIVFAQSECRFICKTKIILEKCIEAIRASDEHLKNRPSDTILWDWKSTWVESINEEDSEFVTILGVAWYNYEYFINKRDTYFNSRHLSIFFDIGLFEEDIDVVHWIKYT